MSFISMHQLRALSLGGLLLVAACPGTDNGKGTEAPSGQAAQAGGETVSTTRAPVAGFVEPRPGLYTGGKPSEADLSALRAEGVSRVVSLLPEGDDEGEAEQVEALGMQFVRIPVRGADDLTEENARALNEALSEPGGKVLLHCASGNRAGGLLALEAYYFEGMTAAAAMELGVSAGLKSLEPAVRQKLMDACQEDTTRC